MGDSLKKKLTEVGISPVIKTAEPDLKDILKENLSILPTPVRELVERITKPEPETEQAVAARLKHQVTLKDLSNKKHTLQCHIVQSRIAQEQRQQGLRGHEAIAKVFKTFIAFGSLCAWYISSGIIEKQAHQTGQIAPPKMSEHNDR